MTAAILIASLVAALAAVCGIAYQLYVRRPAFAVLGGVTTRDTVNFNVKNIGSTAAQRVSVRVRIEGIWYDGQQGMVIVLVPDQVQSFSCLVPDALRKDHANALVAIAYDGALGRRWVRNIRFPTN
jgi:hypothetical protein